MSDSFVFEVPLQTTPGDNKVLDTALEAGRQMNNACQTEYRRRLKLLRESRAYQKALKLPKSKERTALFRKLEQKFGVTDYAMQKFALELRKKMWFGKYIDSLTAQKIATTAFIACNEWKFGKRGKPRFKGKGRFRSLEGKSNASGIRYRDGFIYWGDLKLKCLMDPKDKDGVQAHGMNSRIKFVRLIGRTIKDEIHWAAQLVLAGRPLNKAKHHRAKGKVVGLDVGPSTVAIVGPDKAKITAFCPDLPERKEDTKKLKRSIDRKRKANNPHKYNSDGTAIKGAKGKWVVSKKQKKIEVQLAEQERKLQASRKTQHGTLVNEVLSMGTEIKTEKLSYVGLQKLFGKSVALRAPGMFMNTLARKAENAGGKVVEFPASKFKLSQLCHNCGVTKKKSLNERWHECPCGVTAQRDLYSAFLSRYVGDDNFDRSQAIKDWPGAEPLLEQALSECDQTTSGRFRPASLGLPRQRGLPVKDGSVSTEIKDVVWPVKAGTESLEDVSHLAVRTP